MSILIANDDGIASPGIQALAASLRKLDEVYVVAPDRERSAASHSLTLHRPLRIHERGDNAFAIDGTPTDCVLIGVHKILPKRPSLVVSGINHGANMGDDVTYSGTVSAALEAALMGIPAIAVSLVSHKKFDFSLAAQFSFDLAKAVLARPLPMGIYLNVNVPGDLVGFVPSPDMNTLPYEITQLGKRDYGSNLVIEKEDPRGRRYYWIGGNPDGFIKKPGTDCHAVLKHRISVSPLHADLTQYTFLEDLRHWKLDGFNHCTAQSD